MDTEKTQKGICLYCWNKGYFTEMIGGVIAYGDFIGDKTFKSGAKIQYNYCKCDKGKQLRELVERETQNAREDAGSIKNYLNFSVPN